MKKIASWTAVMVYSASDSRDLNRRSCVHNNGVAGRKGRGL